MKPTATPLTTPPVVMVATAVLLLVQVPPVVESDSEPVPPRQTFEGPVMAGSAGGVDITVTVKTAKETPQLLETKQVITAVPADTPCTTPLELTVAIDDAELDHVGLVEVSTSVTELPEQKLDVPVIAPAWGTGLTVMVCVAVLTHPAALVPVIV